MSEEVACQVWSPQTTGPLDHFVVQFLTPFALFKRNYKLQLTIRMSSMEMFTPVLES